MAIIVFLCMAKRQKVCPPLYSATGVPLGQFTKHFEQLPESVQNYVQVIANSNLTKKIVLFGSRARGDFRENSDFDIAVDWLNNDMKAILQLKADLTERPITLYKIDLFDINNATPDYLNEINTEGKTLWQKKA